MSAPQMRRLSDKGILPASFSKMHSVPICPSCAIGGSKRKAWRTKDGHGSIRKADHSTPGKLVCVDQMVSSQPGLVPQSSGYLTASRIWACTIFLDVFSGYGYGFMIRDTYLNQTILAKQTFERELSKHNIRVHAYRTDNGRFADHGFKEEINICNQFISFCGVGDHGQNGMVERYIGKITIRSRIMLLHAKRFWPEAITHML